MAAGVITEIAGGSIVTNATGDMSLYAQNVDLAASDRVNWKGEDNGVNLGTDPKDPDEGKVLVKTAYFARKVEKKVKRVETKQHTVKAGDTHASVARATPGVKAAELKAAHPKLTPGETVDLRVHSEKVEIFLQRVSGGGVGARLFVVVETTGLKGQALTIEILGSNNTTFVSPGQVATVLVDEAEKTSLTATVGAYSSKKEYTNAAAFANQGIAEFVLAPKTAEATKEWRKKVIDSEEKKGFLHLRVKAEATGEVVYYNEDDTILGTTTDKGTYLNGQGKWFEVYGCLCGRTLEKADLVLLGISDRHARDFLEGVNAAVERYSINTCLRISHFLAQARHESGDFKFLKEIWGNPPTAAQAGYEGRDDLGNVQPGDGKKFMGRGLIQITGRRNYTAYGVAKGEDFTTGANNEKLEQKKYAVDSAGWYWSEYLSVDLNTFADKDDLIYCSYRVNGGFNGYDEREEKVKAALKAIILCSTTDLSQKGTYKLETSAAYGAHDAVFKWATLEHGAGRNAKPNYARYLTLTDGIENKSKAMNNRRAIAAQRSK